MTNQTPTVPQPSPLAIFQQHLARGELAFQVDKAGKALFYPRVSAPAGYEGSLRWVVSAGLGTVYATTYISPRGEPAYNVALIDMDEGFRLMSRVENLPAHEVRIGLRVRFRTHPAQGDDDAYPVFDPLDATEKQA